MLGAVKARRRVRKRGQAAVAVIKCLFLCSICFSSSALYGLLVFILRSDILRMADDNQQREDDIFEDEEEVDESVCKLVGLTVEMIMLIHAFSN